MNDIPHADLVVLLTEPAARKMRQLRDQEAVHAGKAVRVFAQGDGCTGLQYGLTFDDRREDDHSTECHGIPVLVDPVSARYLHGAVVDYQDDSHGGGFRISNPKAKRSCGCDPATRSCC
jgi:iron-sulfur cluster assembly accessory protein